MSTNSVTETVRALFKILSGFREAVTDVLDEEDFLAQQLSIWLVHMLTALRYRMHFIEQRENHRKFPSWRPIALATRVCPMPKSSRHHARTLVAMVAGVWRLVVTPPTQDCALDVQWRVWMEATQFACLSQHLFPKQIIRSPRDGRTCDKLRAEGSK